MQQLLRFSTDALPERDRIAIWAEVFGRYIVKAQVETVGGSAFSQNATLRSLPGLSLAAMSSSGFRASRTSELIADGNDNLSLVIIIAGTTEYRQLGREALVSRHEAVLLSNSDEGARLTRASRPRDRKSTRLNSSH